MLKCTAVTNVFRKRKTIFGDKMHGKSYISVVPYKVLGSFYWSLELLLWGHESP